MSNSVDSKKKSHDYSRPKPHDSEPKKHESKAKLDGKKVSKDASSSMKSAASSVSHKSSFEPAKPKGGASITYHKATQAPATAQKPMAPAQKEVGFPTTTGGASVTTQAVPPAPQGTTQYVLNGLSTIADSFVKDPGNTLKVIGDGLGGFADTKAWGVGLDNSNHFLAETGKGLFNHMIMEPAQALANGMRPVVDGVGNTLSGLQTIGNALVTDPGKTLKVIGDGLGGLTDAQAWKAGLNNSTGFLNSLPGAALNLVTSTVTGTAQQFQDLATSASNVWNNGATKENISALADNVAATGTTVINTAAMVDGIANMAKGAPKLAGASTEGKALAAEAEAAQAAKVAETAEAAPAAQAAQVAKTAEAAEAAQIAEAKGLLPRLQRNLNTLQERAARYGAGQEPLELVNQISDHQSAIGMAESVMKGDMSLGKMYSEMKSMLVDVKLPPGEPLSAANPRQALLTLTQDQNALLEKAAKYGAGRAPIELTNDIQRGQQAIDQAWKAVRGEITPQEFEAALKPGPATPQEVMRSWVQDQNTLLEQAAKYGAGREPLHLINQLKDYGDAINMASSVLNGQATLSELKDAVRTMIIDARVLNR